MLFQLNPIDSVKASYEYSAQEENELSFGEGQILQVLHRIDEDWWLARDESSGECGMVPANYFDQRESCDAEREADEAVNYGGYADETSEQPIEEHAEESVNYYAPPPPPPPLPSFDEPESHEEEMETQEEEEINPVDEISSSSNLKQKCDALFLDSKYAKTKGQLLFEKALYLCTSNTIEHCYDLSELRDYDADELKLTLNSGEKVAIGLGKKDAKKFAELVNEISGYEGEIEEKEAPPLPKAPIVVGPKIPESYAANNNNIAKSDAKTPMMVGVSFEGLEGEEISIFEGEEVYLSSDGDSSLSNSQFARIEKVNGVSGLVPRNFLMTRSEYQKKKDMEAEEAETRKQMAELNLASEQTTASISTEVRSNSASIANNVAPAAPASVARSNSKSSKSSSPWSALASGSGAVALPKPQQQQQKSGTKLENSRLWKDKSGKFQVEAEFVSLIDGKVTILKASGSQVTVPLEILSERDVEYACKRSGVPYTKKTQNSNGTAIKGFDWLAFFLSVGIEAGKAREFGEKFASQSFEESMISTFTSDFLTAQGMQMTEIYKILPEVAKRKAQAMQANAKEKHRSNNAQVVLSTGSPEVKRKPTASAASTLVPFKKQESEVAIYEAASEDSPKIQMFPTIEELESQGAIELGKGNSQVALPGGISVTKTSNDDNSRVVVQPIESADFKERRREVVGADGSTAKEYTRISTSTSLAPIDPMGAGGSSAIALMQQQMQTNAMMQAQAQAQAQVQMQMRMQAQAQAQAQMQMQMRAQAAAQAQAQAQAQYQQQQRMYQMQQQQQAPSVHITIHTGDKGINQNPMTPPMPLMNQPMMQMNNPGMGMMGGMINPSPMNPMTGAMMNPMAGGMNPMTGAMTPMNPMGNMNPFDPTNPYNNGFGF